MAKDSVFNKVMSTIGDNLETYARNVLGFRHFRYIMEKPIGLLSKEYGFSVDTLMRNIGNNLSVFDGYGSPIGTAADPYLNMKLKPTWYHLDEKKRTTSNYLEYIKLAYGNDITNNFVYDDIRLGSFNPTDLVDNINYVGAVRHYRGDTNPNGSDDTRMGLINGYYLNGTLDASRILSELKGKKGITSGVYDSFGLGDGNNSISNGYNEVIGRVKTQSELIGNVIPWSTSDYTYDSDVIGGGGVGNINLVEDILNKYGVSDRNMLSTWFNDETQDTYASNLYRGYGNFYDITYSLGLLSVTDPKTEQFIAKSMYGYNLLSDTEVNFNYKNGDESRSHKFITRKKYYVSNGTRGTNYIDAMTGNDVEFIKYSNNVVRTKLIDAGNDNLWSTKVLYSYAESELKNGQYVENGTLEGDKSFNEGIEFGRHSAYSISDLNKKDVIAYTNTLFKEGKLGTLISRFHGDEFASKIESRANRDMTQTAISKFGVSHGRNLLKKDITDKVNDYSNPYCRVWTYHHQYKSLNEAIRPFKRGGDSGIENSEVKSYRTYDGLEKLSKYGSKTKVGLVKIAPTLDTGSFNKNDVRKCMFSIENLAWKGEKNFFKNHEDQRGPLGGRIMWFPPYGLDFREDTMVDWNANKFINRGENIYTYVNSERSGNLSFKLLIDHPSIVNSYRGMTKGGDNIGDVDDIESTEQKILRFFAGCDILEERKPDKYIGEQEEDKPIIEPKPQPVVTPSTVYDEIVFFVFYPNNYSGVDNEPTDNIRPMEYLANGIGASLICENEKTVEFGTTLDEKYRGYEMNTFGITPTSNQSYGGKCGDNKLVGENYASQKHMGKNGKYRYWGYRVDNRVANEVLYAVNGNSDYNYFDTTSYQLNSIGYEKLLTKHSVQDKNKLYSFAEVFCAIEGEKAEKTLNGLYNKSRVDILRKLIEDYDLFEMEAYGFASSHGYTESNEKLNRNRAESVKKWLAFKNNKFKNIELRHEINKIGEKLGHHDSMAFEAKVWRCAKIILKLSKTEIRRKEEKLDPPALQMPIFDNGIDNINQFGNMTARDVNDARGIASTYDVRTPRQFSDVYSRIRRDEYGRKILPSITQRESVKNIIENNNAEADVEALMALENGDTTFLNQKSINGYSDEYKFFKDLERDEPFLHSKLVEKFKYFDPAFHSITPEGFNSRLTFLNQCTRQGNTNSNSDMNSKFSTATNLAFGRPPICVLRIGDFYNTKIIITSLSINYSDTTWDLNDEGIGIMPMFADVSISFKFLGGSDLAGPVTRLQNALSFNYYANTRVYDERSEKVEYNDDGELITFIPFK